MTYLSGCTVGTPGILYKRFFLLIFLSACLLQAEAQDVDFLKYLDAPGKSLLYLQDEDLVQQLPLGAVNEPDLEQKLSDAENSKNDPLLMLTAEKIGLLKLKNKEPETASKYFSRALQAGLNSDNKRTIAELLVEYGIALQQSTQFEKAIDAFEQASVFAENLELNTTEAFLFAAAAKCRLSLREFEKADESFIRASKAYAATGRKKESAVCIMLAGEVELRSNDFSRAKQNFTLALKTLPAPADRKLLSALYLNIGLVDFKKGRFEDALLNFDKSISIYNDLLVHKLRKDAYMQLFTKNSIEENYEVAGQYHELYRSLKDSLAQIENQEQAGMEESKKKAKIISLLQRENEDTSGAGRLELSRVITEADLELMKREQALEEKTEEIEKLNRDRVIRERDLAKKELQIHRQKNFRNLLLVVIVASVVAAFLLYNRYRFGKKSNRNLAVLNKELKNTVENLHAMRSQLVQSEKMAALGQLTAGIAHEIQNPLNFVNNFSEGARDLLAELETAQSDEEQKLLTAEIKTSLDKIHEHGKRAERIVKSMLQHSRQGNGELESSDINQLVHDAVNLAYHGLRATHKDFQCVVEEDLHADLPKLNLVPEDINRVFLNIANNAFYALRQRCKNEPEFKARFSVSTSIYGDHIFIRLRDNGTGIPKEVAEKIFQPFFTTKPSGQGTGLGLSMSYDIISRHNGRLTLDSQPGAYTEFTIALPLKS